MAISESPDACKTPPNDVPIPYNVVAKLGQSLSVSPNVKYHGFPVVLADESKIDNVTGDEAGSGGGVKSGSHKDEVKFIEGAGTVKANGKRIVRDKDPVSMNKGNTTGKIQSLTGASPAGGITPEGQPVKPTNPPMKKPLELK
jgi:hypothetical protein